MKRQCIKCERGISAGSTTGMCRPCEATDPAQRRKRADARRKAFKLNPDLRERQRLASAEFNRSGKMRALAGEKARRVQIWQYSARARATALPKEVRDLYRDLRMVKRIPAAEARALAMAHHDQQLARFRRKLIEQQASIPANDGETD